MIGMIISQFTRSGSGSLRSGLNDVDTQIGRGTQLLGGKVMDKEEIKNRFYCRLREIHEKSGLSYREVGVMCDINHSYVALILKGVRNPSRDVVICLLAFAYSQDRLITPKLPHPANQWPIRFNLPTKKREIITTKDWGVKTFIRAIFPLFPSYRSASNTSVAHKRATKCVMIIPEFSSIIS